MLLYLEAMMNLGVKEHVTYASGRMKTVCTSAVLAAFGIDPSTYQYSDSDKDVKRLLRSRGWAVRSRMSALSVKRGTTVGSIREAIRKLDTDQGERFYVSVPGHAMLLNAEGETIVDTAPRKRDRRRVMHVSAVYQGLGN